MAVIELESCSPLQPWNPKKDEGWMTYLVPGNKAYDAEGPDALQVPISRASADREKGTPSSFVFVERKGATPA